MTLKRFPQKARTLFGTLAIVIFHGRVYFVTILLGFTFLASPLRIVSEHALADSPPYVPSQVIRLQAPWVSGVRSQPPSGPLPLPGQQIQPAVRIIAIDGQTETVMWQNAQTFPINAP